MVEEVRRGDIVKFLLRPERGGFDGAELIGEIWVIDSWIRESIPIGCDVKCDILWIAPAEIDGKKIREGGPPVDFQHIPASDIIGVVKHGDGTVKGYEACLEMIARELKR